MSSLSADYLQGVRACGISIGDHVKILESCRTHERGWGNAWNPDGMDDTVGKIGVVRSLDSGNGFEVDSPSSVSGRNSWLYPYFVLEVVAADKAETKSKEPVGPFLKLSYLARHLMNPIARDARAKIVKHEIKERAGWEKSLASLNELIGLEVKVLKNCYNNGYLIIISKGDHKGAQFYLPYCALKVI